MKQKQLNFSVNGNLTRRETFDGKEYLVVPVVMLQQQVMNGELLLESEFGRVPHAWNGTQVVINHPQEHGVFISANAPQVLELNAVGQVFNVFVEDQKLKGEIWLDVNKATLLGGEALQALTMLEAGEMVNVSTAYYTETQAQSGNYKGRAYSVVQSVPFPDHLAILPNMDGACNLADGCGAGRFNQKEKPMTTPKRTVLSRIASIFSPGQSVTANEGESYNERWQALDSALAEAEGSPYYDSYIVDVYDDSVIYRSYDDGGTFRRAYTMNDDLEVTLGDAEEVVQRVTYETKGELAANAQEGSTDDDPETEPPPESEGESEPDPADVAPEGVTEERPTRPPPPPPSPDPVTVPSANAQPCGCKAEKRENVTKDAKQEPKANAQPRTTQDFLNEMPDGDAKSFITNGIKQHAAHRSQLIEGLKANERNKFAEETLTAMATDQLEQLSEMLAPADYTGRGGPRVNNEQTEAEEPLMLSSIPQQPKESAAN